ncbi:hypothetical protein V8J88_12180 [Massilia sp. W12]|uniref:hypothetical protein n=1 Tax=Massilia sp. W12 TaxID=3126507 RepID=UPI0030D5D304
MASNIFRIAQSITADLLRAKSAQQIAPFQPAPSHFDAAMPAFGSAASPSSDL